MNSDERVRRIEMWKQCIKESRKYNGLDQN